MQFAIVGAMAYVFVPQFGRVALPAIAALAALSAAERSNVKSLRRLTFFAVPMYGRQLARAHAVAPALAALALPFAYAAGAALRGEAPSPERFATAILMALVSTLVALSAIFRDGSERALYIVLALAAGLTLDITDLSPVRNAPFALVASLAALEGFFALRAFGETLARYDPLPD